MKRKENENMIDELNIPDHQRISQNEKTWIRPSFLFRQGFSPTTSSATANSGDPLFPAADSKPNTNTPTHSPSHFINNLTNLNHSNPKLLTSKPNYNQNPQSKTPKIKFPQRKI
ncbi:hypothetical protein HanRHA438_Chr15g0690081 [Helianthus annuus]|nr:hypothetical protein HanRHA438_Chr15g0690081 [Helianthus annuus]